LPSQALDEGWHGGFMHLKSPGDERRMIGLIG
jgi:hypothetical protein